MHTYLKSFIPSHAHMHRPYALLAHIHKIIWKFKIFVKKKEEYILITNKCDVCVEEIFCAAFTSVISTEWKQWSIKIIKIKKIKIILNMNYAPQREKY